MKTIVVSNQKQLEAGLAIRKDVFVKEQGVSEELEVDEYDVWPGNAVHFLLLDDNDEAIGASRMKKFEAGSAKMQRIAITQAKRGLGYGRELLQAMEQKAAQEGYSYSVLDAQVQAEPFYSKQGYEVISESPFYDAGIEHVRMRKPL